MTAISFLSEKNQSIWYDNLSKDILDSGELKKLIENGISGLTSNPSIFKNAIAETQTYTADIKELSKEYATAQEVCDQLMLRDVANAADLLKSIYDSTNAKDGYASLEVSPELADDTAGTIKAGQQYWQALNRPNIMIKVPATPAGIPAIAELISQGINVNVTLIFSPAVYQDVINAYKDGLKKRAASGASIENIHSVASFFISRCDSWIEKQTDNPELLGKVGIANAMKAYSVFKNSFSPQNFSQLEDRQANKQRILWASTSTKNPDFDPMLYAMNLPFNDSVATHPPKLIEDLFSADLKSYTPPEGFENLQAEKILETMKENDLDPEKMYTELLDQGVASFATAYQDLLAAIEQRLK